MNTDSKPKKTQKERREDTMRNVLISATRLFGEHGYEKTSLDEVAKDAGITTGPIYHYFNSKLELFHHVNQHMESLLLEKLETYARDESKDRLQHGWDDFLDMCKTTGFVQIVLIDAPHILGRENWQDSAVMAKAYELLETTLLHDKSMPLLASEQLSELDRKLIMRMITAALAEAALMVGSHPDYDTQPIIHGILSLLEK